MQQTVKLSIEDRNLLLKGFACTNKALSELDADFSGISTENTLSEVNQKTPNLGQATSANSVPVVIASDQSSLPVSISSIALPTGASTSALQNTGNSSLATIAINTTGIATAANQSAANSSLATIATNTAGSATSALQASGNLSLSRIESGMKAEDSPASDGDIGMNLLGVRRDADTSPVSADGDYHQLIFNSTGRAKVSVKPGATNATTGTITTSTGIVFVECSRESSLTLLFTGTFTGVNVAFEFSMDSTTGSDGNWFTLQGVRTNAQVSETTSGVIATGVAYGWKFDIPPGATYMRVRATALTTGTVNVIWKPATYSFNPLSSVPVLGAGTATIGSISSITSSIVPGTAATNLGKAEDAASASGDTGIFMLGVRRDTLTSSTSATGDYSELAVTTYGAQLVKAEEKHARTYSASARVTPATGATDVMTISGNATTIVYVTKIVISGLATTARLQDAQIIKRTTANTGGTSSSMSVAQHDSSDTVQSSTPITYTVNPTSLGTSAGIIRESFISLGTSVSTSNNVLILEFGDKGRPLVLRGVAQSLSVNLSGTATLAGDSLIFSVEWYEI